MKNQFRFVVLAFVVSLLGGSYLVAWIANLLARAMTLLASVSWNQSAFL